MKAFAQNLLEPPGFGIPLSLFLLTLGILAVSLILVIRFSLTCKKKREKIGLGLAAITFAFLTIAAATPVQMNSFSYGSTPSYCNDNPCGDILYIKSYDDLRSYPSVLRKAIDAAIVKGQGNCCGITQISYFEELSLLPVLPRAINTGISYSYSNSYLFKFMDQYYSISLHHVDVDHTYVYSDTIFTVDAILLINMIAIGFFSIILPLPKKSVAHSSANKASLSGGGEVGQSHLQPKPKVEWIASRRYDILMAGIILQVLVFMLSISLHYSTFHVSSYAILILSVISLISFMTIIVISRRIVDKSIKYSR